jgi:hypothetical protein
MSCFNEQTLQSAWAQIAEESESCLSWTDQQTPCNDRSMLIANTGTLKSLPIQWLLLVNVEYLNQKFKPSVFQKQDFLLCITSILMGILPRSTLTLLDNRLMLSPSLTTFLLVRICVSRWCSYRKEQATMVTASVWNSFFFWSKATENS